jgi:hypothetical protein
MAGVYRPAMAGGRYVLGQTAQEWYDKAKAALARYEFLIKQMDTIGSQNAINQIKVWLGDPSIPDSPSYRYTTVKSDFTQDVAAEGVGAYNVERRQNRVEKLEDFNGEFKDLIEEALKEFGTRRIVTRPGERVEVEGPDLTLPILGGAAAVALAIVLATA